MANRKKIEKVRDKYWEDDRPGVDYDYFEWLVPPEDLDNVVRENTEQFSFVEELDPADFLPDRKKQEEMLRQVYETAAQILKPQQYRMFIMRYMFGLKEIDIAKQMNIKQAYVGKELVQIHFKIRKALQVIPPTARSPRLIKLHKAQAKAKLKRKNRSKKSSKKPLK